MKTFKKPISIVLALLMALSVIVVAPTAVNAGGSGARYIQVFNIWGSLDSSGDYSYEHFTLSKKTQVKVELDGSYSEGYYKIEIENSDGSVVSTREGYVDTEDVSYVVTLAAGDYTAYIYNNSVPDEEEGYSDELRYDFYVYRYYAPPANPTKFRLNKSKISLCRNGTYQLNAIYKPDDVTSKVKYSSSNPKIAKVNSSGYVTAKNLGTVTITAKMGNKKAKCTVVVNRTTIQMACGKKKALSAFINKMSGYKKAKWVSNKKKIISVDKKGNIKTLKHGVAKITAKLGGRNYTITIYSVSKAGVKKRTLDFLKDRLYVPQSLKVQQVKWLAYNGVKIYYKAKNTYGEWRYNAITGYLWYDILYYEFDY